MKKYTWILGGLMAMAITACTSDELMERSEQHPTEGEVVIVTAYAPGGNTDSRVAFTEYTDEGKSDNYTLSWVDTDNFSMIKGEECQTFTKVEEKENMFSGILPSGTGNYYYAVYPALEEEEEATLTEANTVPFDLSTQTGELAANKTYMYASSADGQAFSFSHCTAILKATFSFLELPEDATIEQIKVTTPDAYKVNGTIDLSNGTLTGPTENGRNDITITIPPVEEEPVSQAEGEEAYYIYLPPMPDNVVKKLTFQVTTSVGVYTGTISRNGAIVAGMLYTATVVLTENTCELPDGITFSQAVHNLMTNNTKAIRFIANSVETGTQIGNSSAYMKFNGDGTTLEIHTAANEFVFNADCSFMFSKGDDFDNFNLTAIDFNYCINTANVKKMDDMFEGCNALKSLDLSSFNTSEVESMSNMFLSSGLESITFGNSFVTSNVTNMMSMFDRCTNLTTINFSGFNTPNVINFDTSNVTNMSNMFWGCSSLKTLDLSSFTADKMSVMCLMFFKCENLEELYLQNFEPATTLDNFSYKNMFLYVGSGLPSGSQTKIYVASPNPFEEKLTGINTDINDSSVTTEYAVYVTGTPQ